MPETFYTTTTELKLNLPELIHTAEIHAKYHFMGKLLNRNLIIFRDVLHELGMIFNFKHSPITVQEVSISTKPPNYMAKEFFGTKQNGPMRNETKKIK